MNKKDIPKKWEEYFSELFEDNCGETSAIKKKLMKGPPIFKDEISNALEHIKNGKAIGQDGIDTEIMAALESFGIGKLESILNKLYDTGDITVSLSQPIFSTLSKMSGAMECEHRRTISLINHITKFKLRSLTQRMRRDIHTEISDVQCCFTVGKGTTDY